MKEIKKCKIHGCKLELVRRSDATVGARKITLPGHSEALQCPKCKLYQEEIEKKSYKKST